MSSTRLLAAANALVVMLVLVAALSIGRPDRVRPRPTDLGPVMGFVENRGQWPTDVAFAASAAGEWIRIGDAGLRCGRGEVGFTMTRAGHAKGAAKGGAVTGLRATGAVCHFLRGKAADHVTDARVFTAVRLPAIAPAVDLVVRRAAAGRAAAFAYDLHLGAGAAPGDIAFRVTGADALSIDAGSGELVMRRGGHELRHSAPIASRDRDGQREPVACRFELRDAMTFGFAAAAAIGASEAAGHGELCIDPDLQWQTAFGGGALDQGHAIAAADNGDVFLAGTTQSTDLPTTLSSFDPSYNGSWPTPQVIGDTFVARLAAADGALLWCTYLGGSENDRMVCAGAVGGEAVVTGWTTSVDFPTTAGAFDTTHNGTGDGYLYLGGDVFVTRLAANGQSLVWSSLLGGSQLEYPTAMTISTNGSVAVSGHVHSPDFPVTPGAFANTRSGHSDLFLSNFSADGAALIGSTYYGGSDGEEYPNAMAFAANGDLILAGGTGSSDLPGTAGSFDPTYNGGNDHQADGFVARFSATTSTLHWCTYLGTAGNERLNAIALHSGGSITVLGQIDGPGLPATAGAATPNHLGGSDGFALRLSGDGTAALQASYLGGSGDDFVVRAVPLGGGRVAAIGRSDSPDLLLTPGAAGAVLAGQLDSWMMVLASDLTGIDYATVIGGPFGDRGHDIARTPAGMLAAAASFYWGSFTPTPGGLPYAGGGDALVTQLAGLAGGVDRFGAPSGACGRDARIMTRSAPVIGDADFMLTAGDAPAPFAMQCAVSFAALTTPQTVLGLDIWVDPAALLATVPVTTDGYGCARMPLPIPNDPSLAGLPLHAQFLWLDSCGGPFLGGSDAVTIVIQP